MNVALWIIAGLLALAFLWGGLLKLTRSREQLIASGQTWVEDFSTTVVRAIGGLEVLAAVGLILPAVLDLVPIVVPLAATGIVLLMIGAAVVHARRRESKVIVVNLVFLALAAVVAVGRFGAEAFVA